MTAAGVRSRAAGLWLGAALTLLAPWAMAETAPETEQKPVEAFGRNTPSCREWTDGCLVCARTEDGAPACSTPGIACVPGAVACIRSDR